MRRLSTYSYDAPLIGLENTYYVDQAWMYNGLLDRYTFKLVGKQDLPIPRWLFAWARRSCSWPRSSALFS